MNTASEASDNGNLPWPVIDESADGLERLPVAPVFAEDRITLQTLRGCQQVFSAGLIGRIETLKLIGPLFIISIFDGQIQHGVFYQQRSHLLLNDE